MSNISQKKRAAMLAYLAELKQVHNDDESIRALNEIEAALTEKKYGLVWEEHTEQVDEMLEDNIPVFIENEARKIVADPDQPFNFLIEGDNLHSLKLLEKTHKGKIDVIYIDPPYNTKNKEFIYNDCMIGEDDAYRHSKWLSFMNERLLVAKNLLASWGVIFISIDDNEQAQLKLLADSIFGESNFIAMAIHKNNSNKNQSSYIGVSTEYVLIYAKSLENLKTATSEWRLAKSGAKDVAKKFQQLKKIGLSLEEIELDIKDMYKRPKYSHLSRWNKVDEKGVFKDSDLSRANGPKDYTIINPETGEPVVVPERGWGKSYEELLRLQEEDLIWYGNPETPPGMKSYLEEDTVSVVDSFWYYDNSVDTKMLRKMFGKDVFDNPKPVNMIVDILKFIDIQDATVLDFFAGSGTTGHAVTSLNQEDGGSRKYILCTNNENNICEDVTYQRLNKIQEEFPHNLKYYKTDFILKLSMEEDILSDRLLSHIKEMVELENMCEIDGVNRFIFLREPDLQAWYEQGVDEDVTIYIPSYILLSREVENELEAKQVKVVHIPDYYFLNELREANEL